MPNPPETASTTGIRHRRPRVGERTRGAVDAMQTKIAVGVQNLDPYNYLEQLQSIVDEVPEATGADAAFIALISSDGVTVETVLSSSTGFARCNAAVLAGEQLDNWPWLQQRLGHLRIIEVADTLNGPRQAQDCLLYTSDAADECPAV